MPLSLLPSRAGVSAGLGGIITSMIGRPLSLALLGTRLMLPGRFTPCEVGPGLLLGLGLKGGRWKEVLEDGGAVLCCSDS